MAASLIKTWQHHDNAVDLFSRVTRWPTSFLRAMPLIPNSTMRIFARASMPFWTNVSQSTKKEGNTRSAHPAPEQMTQHHPPSWPITLFQSLGVGDGTPAAGDSNIL
jgi:hypothetical protein